MTTIQRHHPFAILHPFPSTANHTVSVLQVQMGVNDNIGMVRGMHGIVAYAAFVFVFLLAPDRLFAFHTKHGTISKSAPSARSSPFKATNELCPEVPLTPRPGNEMAVVACG